MEIVSSKNDSSFVVICIAVTQHEIDPLLIMGNVRKRKESRVVVFSRNFRLGYLNSAHSIRGENAAGINSPVFNSVSRLQAKLDSYP